MADDIEQLSDEELVELTRQGSKDAYAVLWKRHYSAGMTCAYRIFPSEAEDLVVEAYANILQAIQSGGGPKQSFRSYLYASIRNQGILKRKKSEEVKGGLEEASLGSLPVEGEALSHDDSERINRVFYAMKPVSRKILWLSEVEERPTGEIAQQLGISKTNVSTSAQRARQEFIELWTQDHVSLAGVEPESEHAYVLSHAGTYLSGKPRPRLKARMEIHLKECEECAEKLDEAQQMSGMFRSRIVPAVTGVAASVVLSSSRAFGAEVGVSGLPRTLGSGFPRAAMGVAARTGIITGVAAVLALGGVWAVTTPTVSDTSQIAPVAPVAAPVATPAPVVTPPASPEPASPAPANPPDPASPVPVELAPPPPATRSQPALVAATPAPRRQATPKAAAPTAPAIKIVSVDTGPSNVCFPVVTGTATPGSTVRVGNDGGRAVSVVADAGGRWATGQLTGYTPGRHGMTASAAGQTSASSTATLAKPPQLGASVNNGELTVGISRAIPGIPVDVFIDGHLVGTLTADSTGKASRTQSDTAQLVSVRYHPTGCIGVRNSLAP